jgi:cation transport ATPase
MVVGVPLEEVQRYYADKPRRGFIVDGLTVDELESGQDEAYQTFRTAANEANREEEQRAAEENRKDRRALAELTVMSIMWVVFTFVSLAMWLVVMWTGETACAPIGYYSALVSVVAVVKPMYALILVCREQIKERQRGRRHNIK